jgi:hypothetical protein
VCKGLTFYFSKVENAQLKLYKVGRTAKPAKCIGETKTQDQKDRFCSEIASKVEQLLYISYKLPQLTELRSMKERLLRCCMNSTSLLWTVRDEIFSRRVLDAAAFSEEQKAALMNHMTGSYLWDMVTKPMASEINQPRFDAEGVQRFEAVLVKPNPDLADGESNTVTVELELFSKTPTVKIGNRVRELQLRVGPLEL